MMTTRSVSDSSALAGQQQIADTAQTSVPSHHDSLMLTTPLPHLPSLQSFLAPTNGEQHLFQPQVTVPNDIFRHEFCNNSSQAAPTMLSDHVLQQMRPTIEGIKSNIPGFGNLLLPTSQFHERQGYMNSSSRTAANSEDVQDILESHQQALFHQHSPRAPANSSVPQQQQQQSAMMESIQAFFQAQAQVHNPPPSIPTLPSPAELLGKQQADQFSIYQAAACAAYAAAAATQVNKKKKVSRKKQMKPGEAPTCANCGTMRTPLWRKGGDGRRLCNKCGLYWARHGTDRPKRLGRSTRRQNVQLNSVALIGQPQANTLVSVSAPPQQYLLPLQQNNILQHESGSSTPVDSPLTVSPSLNHTPSPPDFSLNNPFLTPQPLPTQTNDSQLPNTPRM